MKHAIASIAGALGYQVTAKSKAQQELLTLNEVVCDGRRLLFLANNKVDTIQSFHASGQIYEKEELSIIQKHCHGGLFVDVGANVGNHLIHVMMLEKMERGVAFEPNPEAFPLLVANIAYNHLSDRVTCHPVGLSDRDFDASLEVPMHNLGGASLGAGSANRDNTIRIPDCRFKRGDAMLNGLEVNFVKIDVEGHELQVLTGLRATLLRCKPDLFVEVSDRLRSECEAFLREIGYESEETFSRYPRVTNVLFKPTKTYK